MVEANLEDHLYLVKSIQREEIKKMNEHVLLDGWGMYVLKASNEIVEKQIVSLFPSATLFDHRDTVLVRQMHNMEKKYTTEKLEANGVQSIPELVAQVNEQRWFDTVRQLATYNRYTSGSGIATAQQWITAQLQELVQKNPNFTFTTQSFPVGGTIAYNIIATLRGSVRPDEWVIIGGHYDSTSQSPNSAAPGAEDNGSGAAAVLEMARVFVGFNSPSTAIFIFFSGEEQGLYGSKYHASYIVNAGDKNKLKLMHNMDMIAYKASNNPLFQVLLETEPEWESLFDAYTDSATKFTELDLLYSLNAFGSDHEPYLSLGMPALLTIDGDWDSYPHYHRTTDTLDKLTSKLGFEIIKMGVATVARTLGFPS